MTHPGTEPRTATPRAVRMAGPLAAGLLAVVGAAAVAVANPGDGGIVTCPFKAITGLDCPFCGATRATAALLRGDLVAALDHNLAYVLVLLPLGIVAWVAWVRSAWRATAFPTLPTRAVKVGIALVLVWWAVRLVVPWLGSGLSG